MMLKRQRNWQVMLWLVLLLLGRVPSLLAQGTVSSPTLEEDSVLISPEELRQMMEQLTLQTELTLDQAVAAAEEAARAQDLAFNLLGIFEAISFVVTVGGAILGLVGFQRLLSAQNSLTEAREEVEKELEEIRKRSETDQQARRDEFKQLSDSIVATVQQQQTDSRNATLASSLLSFGERQYKASDYQGAIETYKRSLALDSNNPVTYYRIGYVQAAQGQLQDAETSLLRSLEIESEFAPAIVTLGLTYRRMGEKMDAGIERERMLNQGELYMLRGLQMSPKLVDEDGESWWGALGGLYRRRQQTDQAIYAYQQAAVVTPHSSYPFGNLANLFGQVNNIEEMLRMYQRVERLANAEVHAQVDNFWGYFDLLTSQLAIGHVEKAIEILPQVVESVPGTADYAFSVLHDTLSRVGNLLKDYPQSLHLTTVSRMLEEYGKIRSQVTPQEAMNKVYSYQKELKELATPFSPS